MTQQNIHPLPLGTQVTVSDGNPRPPERFKRKLAEWRAHNYVGVVVEHNSMQSYTIHRKPDRGWSPRPFMVLLSSSVPAHKVVPIPGACLAPVKDDRVDEMELLRLEAQAA